MHSPGTLQENFLALGNIWVGNTAVDRTNGRALLLVEEANAPGAFLGSYIVNVFLDRGIGRSVEFPGRASLVDGRVWALGFARPAVDTLFSNQRRHIANCSPHFARAAAYAARSAPCLDLNGKNIGRLRPEQVSARRLRGHRSDDAFGEFLKGQGGRVRGVFDDQWHAFIAGAPQFGLNWYARQQIHMFLNGHRLAATASKNLLTLAAIGTDEVAHVFDNPEQGTMHLPE